MGRSKARAYIFPAQEPITRSEHLPYLLLELSYQTELFLGRLSRQANNAFVYWPTRAPHYFCNKWINYLEGRGNSKNWIVAGLQVGIQSAFRHIGSTANCTLNLPLRKHIFFAGKSKLKITRSVKTISQPKRERCSLLVMGSCPALTLQIGPCFGRPEQEDWVAVIHEKGPSGQNQFWKLREMKRGLGIKPGSNKYSSWT